MCDLTLKGCKHTNLLWQKLYVSSLKRASFEAPGRFPPAAILKIVAEKTLGTRSSVGQVIGQVGGSAKCYRGEWVVCHIEWEIPEVDYVLLEILRIA